MALINFGSNAAEKERERRKELLKLSKTNKDVIKQQTIDLDELSKFKVFGWKGIYFPTKNISTIFSHDIALHKYVNRDGVRLEHTGRGEITITASCVFFNGLSLATQDLAKMDRFNLFPITYNKFLAKCFEGSTGILEHPTLGNLNCKLKSYKEFFTPEVRGGTTIDCVWIETLDDNEELSSEKNLQNLINTSKQNAARVDEEIANATGLPEAIEFEESFLDQLNKIDAIVNFATSGLPQALAVIDNVIYRCNRFIGILKRSVDVNQAALNNSIYLLRANLLGAKNQIVRNQPKQNTTAIISKNKTNQHLSLKRTNNNKNKLNNINNGKTIGVSATPEDVTLSDLARDTNNTINELIELNDGFLKSPTIKKNTLFRYYID